MDYTITNEQENLRIDKYLAQTVPDISRSYLQKLVTDGQVLVNGVPVKTSYKLMSGDIVQVTILEPEVLQIIPEDIPLDI